MTDPPSYGSPGAFRRALTDKLRDLAATSRWTLQELQRQMAYDRLLERLYLVDQGWIIKGATALLARDLGVRGTIDIDVYREVAREIAAADLRQAAATARGAVDTGPGTMQCPATVTPGCAIWAPLQGKIPMALGCIVGREDVDQCLRPGFPAFAIVRA